MLDLSVLTDGTLLQVAPIDLVVVSRTELGYVNTRGNSALCPFPITLFGWRGILAPTNDLPHDAILISALVRGSL